MMNLKIIHKLFFIQGFCGFWGRAFHRLRRIRDAYVQGAAVQSAEDAPLIAQRRTAMARMRDHMREDLGVEPLGFE